MAERGLSVTQVARRTGLDERTVRALQRGTNRPRAKTLHRLAEGLGVRVDEFLVDPRDMLFRRFDRATNPAVEKLVEQRGELFKHWTADDFDELHSRVGTGGPLTADGALEVVEQMNRRRRLHEKLDLLLESTHAELAAEMLELMYRNVEVVSA
jgi:transcriptional regulator with XRE-family HTH domain